MCKCVMVLGRFLKLFTLFFCRHVNLLVVLEDNAKKFKFTIAVYCTMNNQSDRLM